MKSTAWQLGILVRLSLYDLPTPTSLGPPVIGGQLRCFRGAAFNYLRSSPASRQSSNGSPIHLLAQFPAIDIPQVLTQHPLNPTFFN